MSMYVGAVRDRAEIVRALEDAFGEQKPGDEFAIRAGRSHDDGKRPAMQADLERFFCGGSIDGGQPRAVSHPHHVNRFEARCHRSHGRS